MSTNKEGTMAEKTEAEFSDNDRIAYCECGFFWTVPTGMPWRDCENCDEAPIDLIASYKALAQQDQGTGVGEAVRHHLELAIEAKDRQASDDRIRAALSMLNLPATPEPQQEVGADPRLKQLADALRIFVCIYYDEELGSLDDLEEEDAKYIGAADWHAGDLHDRGLLGSHGDPSGEYHTHATGPGERFVKEALVTALRLTQPGLFANPEPATQHQEVDVEGAVRTEALKQIDAIEAAAQDHYYGGAEEWHEHVEAAITEACEALAEPATSPTEQGGEISPDIPAPNWFPPTWKGEMP